MNPPESTRTTATLRRMKRATLAVLALAFVVFGAVGPTITESAPGAGTLGGAFGKWAAAVAVIGPTFVWCFLDSEENGYRFGKYLPIAFVAMLPLALAIYFYRSRGFARGNAALAKAIGFGALLCALAATAYVATALLTRPTA